MVVSKTTVGCVRTRGAGDEGGGMVGGGENGASTSQIGSGDGSGDGDAEGLVELPPRMTPGSTQLAAHGRCAHEARPFSTAAGLGCAMHQLYAVTHAGMQAGGGPGGDGGDGGGEDAAGGGGGEEAAGGGGLLHEGSHE